MSELLPTADYAALPLNEWQEPDVSLLPPAPLSTILSYGELSDAEKENLPNKIADLSAIESSLSLTVLSYLGQWEPSKTRPRRAARTMLTHLPPDLVDAALRLHHTRFDEAHVLAGAPVAEAQHQLSGTRREAARRFANTCYSMPAQDIEQDSTTAMPASPPNEEKETSAIKQGELIGPDVSTDPAVLWAEEKYRLTEQRHAEGTKGVSQLRPEHWLATAIEEDVRRLTRRRRMIGLVAGGALGLFIGLSAVHGLDAHTYPKELPKRPTADQLSSAEISHNDRIFDDAAIVIIGGVTLSVAGSAIGDYPKGNRLDRVHRKLQHCKGTPAL